MFRTLPSRVAAFVAVASLVAAPSTAHAQKALVYCPVGIDAKRVGEAQREGFRADNRHGGLGRDARDVSPNEVVQHDVADARARVALLRGRRDDEPRRDRVAADAFLAVLRREVLRQ